MDWLKKAQIQPSAPRVAIAQFVWGTTDHPTAEDVKAAIGDEYSLATVYNTLHLLVEKGLLREVREAPSEAVRYDRNTKPHFHFFDEATGEMHDLDPRVLRIAPDMTMLGADYQVTGIEVTVRGTMKSKPSNQKENKS